MIWGNLDSIVRRQLLETGLPIHYYSELLFHSATAIRELSFDTLKIINTVRLPTNDYAAFDTPGDLQDVVAVCVPTGGALHKLPQQDWLNPIRIHDTDTGQFVPHENENTDSDTELSFFGLPGYWSWFWNVNDYGEPTGRYYGSTGGTTQGWKFVPERRQVQMTDNFANSNIVLVYISDGQQADNATQVDVKSISTIHAYCNWKRSKNAAIKDSYEAMTYYNERRLLRARLSPLTKVDILNILRQSYTAAIKS